MNNDSLYVGDYLTIDGVSVQIGAVTVDFPQVSPDVSLWQKIRRFVYKFMSKLTHKPEPVKRSILEQAAMPRRSFNERVCLLVESAQGYKERS